MSDSPDPKVVRAISRKLLLDPHMTHSDFKACIRDHIGTDAPDETFSAWYNAVRADAYKGTVETVASWPDEQPQDERGGDSMRPEDVPDGLVQAAADAIHAFYAAHPDNESEDDAIRVLLAAAIDARDAKTPTHCTCGCELGKPCGCDDSADHEPAARDANGDEQR